MTAKKSGVLKELLFISLLFISALFVMPSASAFGGPVTSPYGYRTHPITGEMHCHSGLDIGLDEGTVVPSCSDGTVVYAVYGWNGGYGNLVEIQMPDGHVARYAHLSEINVSYGDHVSQGDFIALSGNTGRSTGGHLHFEVDEVQDGQHMDPTPYALAAGWNLNGDTTTNVITEVGKWALGKVTPAIDINFTKYFAPSEELAKIAKQIMASIVLSLDFAEKNLFPLLVILAIIDFSWLMIPVILGMTTLGNLSGVILRLIRYGFFFMIFLSWRKIVDTFFLPILENISSTYTGHELTETSFLHFDELFISVSHVISPFLHVDSRFNIAVALFVALFVLIILALTIIATIYLIEKLILFYISCVFGVLGIPLFFLPKMKHYGKNMLSGILANIFDLIITAFLFVFLSDQLAAMEPIDKDSVASLVLFAGCWGLLVFFIPSFSKRTREAFNTLWS